MNKFYTLIIILMISLMINPVMVQAYGTIDPAYNHHERISDNSGTFSVKPENQYIFPDAMGPEKPSVVEAEKPTPWSKYSVGTKSRMAILLTDPDSCWLGLAHGLKSIGIPFMITTDYKQALEHKVVMVYPIISGKVLSAEALKALSDFPSRGGTLIGFSVLGGGLQTAFGFKSPIEKDNNFFLAFNPANSALLASFQDERELKINLGDKRSSSTAIGTVGYSGFASPPLAVFEDGTAAITQNTTAKGNAYAFGIDVGYLLQMGYNDSGEELARGYVNEFEPTLDVFLRLLKEMYSKGERAGVTLGTVPFNKSLSVMLTHDLDYGLSEVNALTYANYEKSQGIKATYFVQTKYITDWNEKIFFDKEHIPYNQKLYDLGMELGSHSVAHAYAFSVFPLGTGTETYPTYAPFVADRYKAYNGTILGELRVSKFLLEKVCGYPQVVSFRPGHLANPRSLPQALSATGYLYGSDTTADNSLTHLPYQLSYERGFTAETDIFEFPITIEDEIPPLMGDRIPQAVDLARKIAKYGGEFVILIHPNVVDHKLKFEQGFVEAVKDWSWFGSIGDFGKWWSARNKVEVDVSGANNTKIVNLIVPVPMEGLTLSVPRDWKLQPDSKQIKDVTQVDDKIVLNKAEGNLTLTFTAK